MSKVENIFTKNSFFFYVCICILALSGALIYFIDNNLKQQIVSEFRQDIENEITQRTEYIDASILSTRNALDFFYSTPPISGIVRATENDGIDPRDGTPLSLWIERLEIIFEAYLENSQAIKQVRLIQFNDTGSELIRVEKIKDNIRVADKTKLQNKGNRDYFKTIRQLKYEQTYVSSINLNREWGEIEYPHQPTFRVARNIYDDKNNAFGFIIINIDASFLLDKIQSNIPTGLKLFLLNREDGIILSPIPEREFEFEFAPEKKWTSSLPLPAEGTFSGLTQVSHEIDASRNFYFLKNTVRISPSNQLENLHLIVGFDETSFNEAIFSRRATSIFTIFTIVLVFVLILITYQRWLNHRINTSRNEAQLAAIISDSKDAIIGTDLDGKIQSWNKSAEDILGYSDRKAIGNNLYTLLDFELTDDFINNIAEKILSKESIPAFDVDIKNGYNKRIIASVTLSPIIIKETNEIEGVAAIIRDITEKKAIEKEILDLNANLEKQVDQRTQELKEARNAALNSSKIKSDFIANVSHEIRTPMNGVVGMLHLINKEPLTEQQQKYLNMAENSATALTVLINDILDFSKIEAGKLEVDPTNTDLIKLIGDTTSSLALTAASKELPLICDLSGITHPVINADANRIRQIIINLLNNAIKFTSEGRIVISASTEAVDDTSIKLNVAVKDTGVGIAEDKIEDLFKSFSQEESGTARKYGGTGLGLAISKKLSQLLGGDISVRSQKDLGSEFSFHILANKVNNHSIFDAPKIEDTAFFIACTNSDIQKSIRRSLLNVANLVEASSKFEKNWNSQILKRASEQKKSVIITTDPSAIDTTDIENENTLLVAISASDNYKAPPPWKSVTLPFTPYDIYRASGILNINELSYPQDTHKENSSALLDPQYSPHKGKRILLVDDNNINLEVGKGVIEDLGIEVDTAGNGEIAIEKLSLTDYAIIFMDCQMPVMDGFTTTRNIRANTSGNFDASIPIIAMTANAMSGTRDECLAAGMNDYITKPIDADEVAEKLLYWLNISDTNQENTIKKSTVIPLPTTKNRQTQSSNKTEIWDFDTAIARLKNREDRLSKLIDMFISGTPQKLEKLKQFTEKEDFTGTFEAAHELKGPASNLACDALTEHCCNIEIYSKEKQIEALKAEVTKIVEAYNLTQNALTNYKKAKSL